MNKKFHIKKDGNISACTASGECPLGSDNPHFNSMDEAVDFVSSSAKNSGALIPPPSAKNLTKTSKKLSYILRHDPQSAGIELSRDGYAPVGSVLKALRINKATLEDIVSQDGKGRYSFSDNGNKIRANQGHSVNVDLGHEVLTAPNTLYHGTSRASLDGIMGSGINAGQRHAVHLSENLDTAWSVADRRSNPIVLVIDSAAMNCDGIKFTRSANGVWLTDNVPKKYISDAIWSK